ncbi:hypothetical protein EJ04DRAFT_593633 [Polyplosphaeria fusca]|uniref:Dystroglycan-type cadherin-like domain-containing protein n=1 Tax=Polyplosphaeria fusca TaxID=682080 RepID=A0A9P4R5G8_9PLEO|nr:hypothetical protein EJ04DRAFT_593633 [Polyplosphaeria fusca]
MVIRQNAMAGVLLMLLNVVVEASTQVNYPMSSQFPPVARVGERYSFQLAPTTFHTDSSKLQYSLGGNPSWLSLNGQNRTLWGTPGTDDIGEISFTIIAAGEAGAVANMDSKLLVTDDSAPTATGNISQALSNAGQLSGPGSVTLPPAGSFDIRFPLDMFQKDHKSLSYHATLADHTPLPAWISFDASALHFAGTTPPLTSGPQSFDILLVASDTPTYAASSKLFSLIISDHQLLFRPTQETISVAKEGRVEILDLQAKLFLDNKTVKNDDVTMSATLPSWLSLDEHTFAITGPPPPGLMSQDLVITANDKLGDVAKMSIRLEFESRLFTTEVGQLNVNAGQFFEKQIPRSILANDDMELSVDLKSLGQWLHFDPSTFTISGTIPEDFAPSDVEVSMTANSLNSDSKDAQSFQIHVLGFGTHVYTGPVSSSTATGIASGPDASSSVVTGSHSGSKRVGVIVGSIFGAAVALGLILILIRLLCRRRKKNAKGYISPRSPRSPRKNDISRPILMEEEWSSPPRTFEPDLEKGEGKETLPERTPEYPPQIMLDLTEVETRSVSSSIDESAEKILADFNDSAWGIKDDAGPSHQPTDSMRVPTDMARRESEKSHLIRKHRRKATAIYRDPYRTSSLPINRRLTGLGHGRHTYVPSQSANNSSILRRPLSDCTFSSKATSIPSTVPSALPRPAIARHTTQLTSLDKRNSIRLVPSTSTSLVGRREAGERTYDSVRNRSSARKSLLDRRTIDEKRQSYIKKRASAQSPFFGASSSRISSASYKSPLSPNDTADPMQPGSSPLAARGDIHDRTRSFRDMLPESLRIRKPLQTPSVEAPLFTPGSLRQPRTPRSFTRKTTSGMDRDRAQNGDELPVTGVFRLRSGLNNLTRSKVYEDDELSESAYSTEEEDIEEAERQRETMKPDQYQFTLPPLKLNPRKSRSKTQSKRDSKRSNKRDPTPYSLALEHGGKENYSSSYSLAQPMVLPRSKSKRKSATTAQPPERPKTAVGQRHSSRTKRSLTPARSSTHSRSHSHQYSQARPLSQHSHKSRHSQAAHSRSQSRQVSVKHTRDRSRTQSSAYPYFDSVLPTDSNKHKSQPPATGIRRDTSGSLLPGDLSGNMLDYGVTEDPTIEEIASSSIGLRASNGRVNSPTHSSRLALYHDSSNARDRKRRSRRITTIGPHMKKQKVGLGMSLTGDSLETPMETPSAENRRTRERTPLSLLDNGNGASPERARVVEGKGKKVSVEGGMRKSSAWGSLKGVLTRGREASLGADRETKAFL